MHGIVCSTSSGFARWHPDSDILSPLNLALDASLSVDRSCGLDLNKLSDNSLVETFDKEAYLISGEWTPATSLFRIEARHT